MQALSAVAHGPRTYPQNTAKGCRIVRDDGSDGARRNVFQPLRLQRYHRVRHTRQERAHEARPADLDVDRTFADTRRLVVVDESLVVVAGS
jgi:hypothetical protein